ncbi:MAG: DUF3883 domain-containing protein [Patescibacteria group bacterium UBA2103]
MNYFIAPRSGERSYKNFESTIKHGVPLERISKYFNSEEITLLDEQEVIYAWGNRKGTASSWKKMQEGDIVIFYANKKLVMYGEVYFKKHDPDLALTLWPPDDNGNPWEYVFFLKNIKYISMPIEIFNNAVGYKTNNFIQGFMSLLPERVSAVSKKYESVEKMLLLFADEYSSEMPGPQDKVYVSVRKEVSPNVSTADTVPVSKVTEVKVKNKGFIDFEIKNKNNAKIGSLGEEIVIRYEKDHLNAIGRSDLAQKVVHVAREDTYAGFDILSFDETGKKKRIEVKSTVKKLSKSFSFYISRNEKDVAEDVENYFIYLVFDVTSKNPKVKIVDDPFKNGHCLSVEAINFRVKGEFKTE